MNTELVYGAILLGLSGALLSGCGGKDAEQTPETVTVAVTKVAEDGPPPRDDRPHRAPRPAASPMAPLSDDHLYAEASYEETGVSLAAMIHDGPNGMVIRLNVSGLTEGFHGVHLHKVGDCSDAAAGFKASGSHVNPAGKEHGLLNPAGFEAADLPNVYANPRGHARTELFTPEVRLADVLDEDGFAFVVHQNQDDHVTQPIGGAGPRLGCLAFNP